MVATLGHDLDVDPLDALAARIRQKEAVVAVVGLGYVGLPLLVAAHDEGFPVIGYDADEAKVRSLQDGRSYVVDVADSVIGALDQARFDTDPAVLSDADVILICVPTPLKDSTPDLSMVQLATEQIALMLTPGRLVVLESTTYPGTTEEIVRPILERLSGLELGRGLRARLFPRADRPRPAGPSPGQHPEDRRRRDRAMPRARDRRSTASSCTRSSRRRPRARPRWPS